MGRGLRGLLAAAAVVGAASATAATAPSPPAQSWSFDGIFGTFDRPALRRGLQVYREVCSSCHSLNQVAYRHLGRVGFSAEEIRTIASEVDVEDGPDETGEMFERPGRPADFFQAPFPNDEAARSANGGALPPDLSLMTKARKGGADYLHALLVGYREEAPAGFELMDGMYYNDYFAGHQIAMAPPWWRSRWNTPTAPPPRWSGCPATSPPSSPGRRNRTWSPASAWASR